MSVLCHNSKITKAGEFIEQRGSGVCCWQLLSSGDGLWQRALQWQESMGKSGDWSVWMKKTP